MKTSLAIAFVTVLASGCGDRTPSPSTAPDAQPKPAPALKDSPPAILSAEPNSFHQVTAKLDSGGHLFVYLGTEQVMEAAARKIGEIRHFAEFVPELEAGKREAIRQGADVAEKLVRKMGLTEISGLGVSSIATAPDFYRTKVVLHHYEGRGSGYLWSLFGSAPRPLDGLDLLPQSTAMAFFSDFDLQLLWKVINQEAAGVPVGGAADALAQLPAMFEMMTGLNLDDTLSSLDGHFGLVLTFNEEKKIPIPVGDEPLLFPEPALLLAVRVNNDLIFQRVQQLAEGNPLATQIDEGELKMITVQLPLPLPVELRLSLAQYKNYLFLASTDRLIREVIAVNNGEKPGFKQTPQYQKLADGLPETGNNFAYRSESLGAVFAEFQRQALGKSGDIPPGALAWTQGFFGTDKPSYSFAVSAKTDEGWISVMNGSSSFREVAFLPAVAVSGGLAAIAIPNFVKARETAHYNTIINNLRMLDGAKEQWALENRKQKGAPVTEQDISDYLRGGKVKPVVGETYKVNALGQSPAAVLPQKLKHHAAGSEITLDDL